MYIKLINMNFNGKIDYKGLNIKLFKSGTQVYDFDNCLFLAETKEQVTATDEILIITEEEYETKKEEIKQKIAEEKAEQVTMEQRIDDIELTLLEMAGVI